MSDPFDQSPDLVGEIQAEKAYGPIYSAQYRDAQKSARANELGHRLGIPPDIVEADIPNMMARDRMNQALAHARANQAYAKVMANPRLAAAGIDDKHLPAVAQAVDQHRITFGRDPISNITDATGVLAGRLASGITGIFAGLSGAAHGLTEGRGFSPVSTFLDKTDPVAMAMRLFGSQHDRLSAAAAATRYTTSNRNFNDVASGVESIPLVASAAIHPAVALSLFGATGFGDAYEEGRKEGLSPNRSALYGVGDAAIQAGTSFLPEKYLGGVLAGKGGVAKTIGSAVGLNGVMTALTGLNHWYFIDRPKGVTFGQFEESLPDQLRSSLVSTLATMGVTIGAGHVASRIAGHAADARSHESLDQVMDASAKSSTRTSNPSDFEAALNQLAGDSEVSDLYVPAEKVLDLFQPQEGKAQRDLRADPFWGQYAGQIAEAGPLGGDVIVPLSAAATHLAGSTDWAAIRDHVRTRPGGASRAELNTEHSSQELEALASDIAKKLDEAVPQLKAQGLTQEFAANLGYKGDQADAVSKLLGAGLARAHALEVARSEAAGKPAPSLEEFASQWLPQGEKTTQAEYDASRAANEGAPDAEAAQDALNQSEQPQRGARPIDPEMLRRIFNDSLDAVPQRRGVPPIAPEMLKRIMGGFTSEDLNDTQRRGNISIARDEQGMMTGAVIRAFEASDFSTAIHETGHFFLEDLKRRALGDGGTEAEKADWQAVKDWMTGNGHAVDAEAVPEAAHEMWARGFERYIYEGKSPSTGLKAVFAKMRDFMVSLYRSMRAFNSPITPEIRSVMDRLLASDDEINARREELKLGDQALNDLMSAEEQQRYAALGEEARSEARDKLYDRVLSTLRAERTREVSRRKSEIRQEIGDQTDAQPIFRALKILRSGMPQEDGTTARATLPREWLVENYGEDVLGKLPKGVPPIYDDTHGVDSESLAHQAGFDNADALVQKLLAHEDERQKLKASGDTRSVRRSLVETMTEERLRNELGDPFANLEEEADAALANDRQADRLSLELRALSRQTGKDPVPWKLAKDWAKAHVRSFAVIINSKSVAMYQKNATKAATAVEDALVQGDYEAAFRAKQQQVLNLALMSEAKAAKDETLQAAKRLRKIAKARTLASVDQDYLDQAHRLLENVDMKSRPDKAVDRRMAFEAWHARQVEMEIDPVVPPEYQSLLGQTHWSRLSVDGLLDLDKAVKQIVKLGRLKQELKDGQKTRNFNEGVSEMQDQGGSVPPRKPRGKTTDPRRSFVGRASTWLRGIDAAQIKGELMAIWMDNWAEQGPWWRMMYGPFAEAQGVESDLLRQYHGVINPLIKSLPKATARSWLRPVDTPELIIRNPNHSRAGEAWQGTKDQIVLMALNWGNLGNRQRLLDGFGFREADMASVFDRILNGEDWRFVQGVWDSLKPIGQKLMDLEAEVNGVAPEKVESAQIVTPYGTLEGGYFPIVYDPMETTAKQQVDEDKLAPSGGWWTANTRSSAVKQRAESIKGRPLLLSMNVITRHVGEVIHDVTHRQAVNQARKLLGDDRITNLIKSRLGPEYLREQRAWVEAIARPNTAYSRESAALTNVARYLNKGATTVGLGFRLSTSLVQTLGIPFSAKDLGTPALAKGLAIVTAHPVQAYKEMVARSAEMRARSDALDDSIMDMVNDHASGKLKPIGPKGIAKYAFQGIAYMDVVSRTTVWTSAYNKGLSEGMSEEDAIRYGDRIVRESHGIGFQKDRSSIQRASPWARMWYQFFSYQNALYNAQRDTIRRGLHGQYGEAARRAWWVFVVPAVLHSVLLGNGPEDDDIGSWAKWLGKEVVLGNLESIPGVGSIAKAVGEGYDYRGVSLMDTVAQSAKGGKGIYKWAEGEGELTGSAIQSAINAAGLLFAKPLGQIGATTKGIYNYENGTADPHSVGDWYYLLTRGSIPAAPTAAERIAGRKE